MPRWLIEVTPIGGDEPGTEYVVEAERWQSALVEVRKSREESGPLSRLSLEILPDGHRAVDPERKLRYIVYPAEEGADSEAEKGAPDPTDEAPPLNLPPHELVVEQDREPDASNPLAYRERAFRVEPGTTVEAAERLLQHALGILQEELRTGAPGKMIELAAFDYDVSAGFDREPLATLSWKDWRTERPPASKGASERPSTRPASAPNDSGAKPSSEPPVASAVASEESVEPSQSERPRESAPLPAAASERPPPSDAPQSEALHATASQPPEAVSERPRPESEKAVGRGRAEEPPSGATKPMEAKANEDASTSSTRKDADEGSAGAPAAAEAAVEKPTLGRRRNQEDLLVELFETMHELHFMRDMREGVTFVLDVLARTVPSGVAVVHVFDINEARFVVVGARGLPKSVLAQTTPGTSPLYRAVLDRKRHLRLSGSAAGNAKLGDQWKGQTPPDRLLLSPAIHAGRDLGMLELAQPPGDDPFSENEGNAVDYIAGQLAEFLANRPIVLDPEEIRR